MCRLFSEKLTLPRRRTSRRMLASASISIGITEITGITEIGIKTTALSKERTSTLTRKTKEKMERKLKNFSKRTGNWKLIILTTWGSRRKSCAASTPLVSRNHPPSSRRESCLSSRPKTQLHRLNQEQERLAPSPLVRYSAWTRPATTLRLSSFHPPESCPCRSPSWFTPLANSWALKCTLALAALSFARTSASSSRDNTSLSEPPVVSTT